MAPAILGDDRAHRITVMRRGALTRQVLVVMFLLVSCALTLWRP